jgi:hypothetical protein
MWDMVLKISKDKQHYAKVELAREYDVAIARARDFVARFPESEGFKVTLYRWENTGQPVDFTGDPP